MTRALAAAQGAGGLLLLIWPDRAVATLAPDSQRPPRWLVRLLGTRRVLQEVVTIAVPSRRVLLLGAATDALHAASMLVAAVRWPRLRRAALVSAGIAAGSAVLGAPGLPPRRAAGAQPTRPRSSSALRTACPYPSLLK